jgi:hypothetical protein
MVCLEECETLVLICNARSEQVGRYVHGAMEVRRKGGMLHLPLQTGAGQHSRRTGRSSTPKFWGKRGDVLKENWDKVLERLDK